MGKINLLTSEVYNRISAGEVVERPYSVVKELIENSVDAGATAITVEVENGGTTLIRVSDDGSGMDREDLERAFLPHATSKIKKSEDLNVIRTLGFRGEALPSIGAVAKVKIVSILSGADTGYSVTCNGGTVTDVEESAASGGTTVTVEDLFYNTPVRAKFLKTERSEEADITNVVSRLILAHPEIAFTYIAGGKTVYRSFGGNEEEALIAVYGKEAVENCFFIDTEKHGLHIHGYLGKHFYTKPNRTYQTVVLNGRYIVNQTVATAIHNAYQSYLMKRNYPFYCLYVDMPSELVDVNVHPNKADVRFQSNQVVYGAIYSVVSSVLDGSTSAIEIVKQDGKQADVSDNTAPSATCDFEKKERKVFVLPDPSTYSSKTERPSFSGRAQDSAYEAGGFHRGGMTEIPPLTESEKNAIFEENKRFIAEYEKKAEAKPKEIFPDLPFPEVEREETAQKVSEVKTAEPQSIPFTQMNYVGQVFKTYLILEAENAMYLVDQHAAHERMIYDRLKMQVEKKEIVVQPMLDPYVLTVNAKEEEFVKENLSAFSEIGIEMEEFGQFCYRITAVPVDLMGLNVAEFFRKAFLLMDSGRGVEKTELFKEKLMQTACKAAIKAGFSISEGEIKRICEKLSENPGLTCPHGRPVAVKVEKTELEKWFKRLV